MPLFAPPLLEKPPDARIEYSKPLTRGLDAGGFFLLQEGAGGVTRDLTRGSVGTFTNIPKWVPGRTGGPALRFTHAAQQYVSVPMRSGYYTSPITVLAWVRRTATSSTNWDGPAGCSPSYVATGGWWFGIAGSGTINGLFVDIYTPAKVGIASTYVVPLNRWDLCGFTYNNTTLTVYGGGLAGGSATGSTGIAATTTPLFLGMRFAAADDVWPGDIDSVLIASRAWSAAEVAEYYTRGYDALLGQPRLWLALPGDPGQLARPNADTSIGTWTTQAGGGTNLYAALNETVADDANYVQSIVAP